MRSPDGGSAMANPRGRLFLPLGLLALALFCYPAGAKCCPFCAEEKGPTLVGDFNQASLVMLGSFTNFRPGGEDGGTTDFVIEKTLKPHEAVKNKKTITFRRSIPPTKSKFVVFCDVYKGEIDPYRGVEVPPGSDLVNYLTEALAKKDGPIGERLRLCFKYLNSADVDVALDAYREFQRPTTRTTATWPRPCRRTPSPSGCRIRRRPRTATGCTPRCWATAATRSCTAT